MNRTRQRGFTLIELMVALLVSSLLVGMILAIFSRMSLAYRGQQQIAGVQQVLAAARAAIELDAKQAGLGMPQGFKTVAATGTVLQSPVQVINSSTGPDQIAFFYIDPSAQALVTSNAAMLQAGGVNVADAITATSPFQVGDLVVLTTSSTAVNSLAAASPDIATYDACALRVANVTPSPAAGSPHYTFEIAVPWGSPTEGHCTTVVPSRTMMYRLVAHAYRIDTTAPKIGVLERSSTGNLANDEVWEELAYGFSDLQTAVRIYDPTPAATDLDADGEAHFNWYSSGNQNSATTLGPARSPAGSTVLGVSISLVAHTDRNVEGIATGASPNLIGLPTAANNPVGDHGSVALPAAPPNDLLMPGQRIYRYTTFQVDVRNLGVGFSP